MIFFLGGDPMKYQIWIRIWTMLFRKHPGIPKMIQIVCGAFVENLTITDL